MIPPTFRKTESKAAEYLKPLSSLSYSFSLLVRRLSIRNSSASPTGFDLIFSLTLPWPIEGKVVPRKDSNAPERRTAAENGWSGEAISEAFGFRRRIDKVPSDMPAAIWVSSG